MNLKSTLLGAAVLSMTLFSCTKDEVNVTDDTTTAETVYEPQEFMAMSEQARVCGSKVKPVTFKIKRDYLGRNYKLHYYGFTHNQVQSFYPDYADGDKRYRSKSGQLPDNRTTSFAGPDSAGYYKTIAYMAAYGGGEDRRKYFYCIKNTDRSGDQRIGKQYPTWGSCSGARFDKDITWIMSHNN